MPKKRKESDLERELKKVRKELDELRLRVEAIETQAVPEVERIRTYVDGLDDVLGGGIPSGHVVLLAGPSGTMKSSLSLYILLNNWNRDDIKGVHISFEERKESLLKSMESMGIDLKGKDLIVDIGRLRFERQEVDEAGDWIKVLEEYVEKRVKKDGVSLVAIDSLNSLYSLSHLEDHRKSLFRFFTFLREIGATTILISEWEEEGGFPHHEDYLADGVFFVNFRERSTGEVDLQIRCAKLRHSNHSRNYFKLIFRNGKFYIEPLKGSV